MELLLPLTSIYEKQKNTKEEILFNFKFIICDRTGRIHLKFIKENPITKYKYEWMTCYEPEEHLDELVKILMKDKIINIGSKVYGFSFKDKSTLERIKKIAKERKNNYQIFNASEIGIPMNGSCLYETLENAKQIFMKNVTNKHGRCDLLIARHVIEHAWDLGGFMEGVTELTKDNGIVVIEIPDCEKGFMNNMQTLIWEEHYSYFTEETIISTMKYYGYNVERVIRYEKKLEDSIVLILSKYNKPDIYRTDDKTVARSQSMLRKYTKGIRNKKKDIENRVTRLTNEGYTLVLFGAGHYASTFLAMNNISRNIKCAIDDNCNKIGRHVPGSNVNIEHSSILKDIKSAYVITTTNPENSSGIKEVIKKINPDSIVKSIFEL